MSPTNSKPYDSFLFSLILLLWIFSSSSAMAKNIHSILVQGFLLSLSSRSKSCFLPRSDNSYTLILIRQSESLHFECFLKQIT
ncbi:hypothetical protein A4A49_41540 [Nicotiana attenuata]|uniref:Uncharacterized protein n=1 Tax=Nicotiana attenuata TaxID=49451 RepID=A0A1J6JWX8_NICAT|nr:hypothetical protein A4A49_41540 [Nicotiana attenuata]